MAKERLKNVFSLGIRPLWRFVARVVENRQAVRAGKPRPYTPGELVIEALELGAGATLPVIKNRKVRDGIEDALELVDEATPGERPGNKHRGVR